jgi:hypothetical protein
MAFQVETENTKIVLDFSEAIAGIQLMVEGFERLLTAVERALYNSGSLLEILKETNEVE